MPTHAQRLIHAVRTSNHDRLHELINRHGDVGDCSAAGRTALHAAAEEGDVKAATILVESGIDVNARMKCGRTALHLAAGYGGGCDLADPDLDRADLCDRQRHHPMDPGVAEAVTEILKENNARIPADLLPETTIPGANKADVFLAVLEAYANPEDLYQKLVARGIDLDRVDPHFAESLRGRPRYLRMVEFLLEHGADLHALDNSDNSPLHSAVELGRPEMVELLLKRGANSNPDSDESSGGLIDLALDYSKIKVADALLRHGAKFDFNAAFHFHEAASNGRQEVMLWLWEHGADIDKRREDGNTPLLDAISNGHDESIAWLIERKANIHVHNEADDGLMHAAACWPKCLTLVIPLGLPIDEPNAVGRTPMHLAAQSGDAMSVQALVRAGAAASPQDHEGNTPLHSIFFSEEFRPDVEFPVFHALIEAGADRSLQNHEGKTAFDLATQWDYPVEYLELLRPGSSGNKPAQSFIWLGAESYRDFLPGAILDVEIGGQIWPSCEHYFHAQKSSSPAVRERIRQIATVSEAVCHLRETKSKPPANWPRQCDAVMRAALLSKFRQHQRVRDLLAATENAILISDSNCDWYWVERPGVEFNTIGNMLMSIRTELRAEI